MTAIDTVHADDTDSLSFAEAIENDDVDAVRALLKRQGAWTQDDLEFEFYIEDGGPEPDNPCNFSVYAVVDSRAASGVCVTQASSAYFSDDQFGLGGIDYSNETWTIDDIEIARFSRVHEWLKHGRRIGELIGFDLVIPRSLDLDAACNHIGTSHGFTRDYLAWTFSSSEEVVAYVCENNCRYDAACALLSKPDREYFVSALKSVFDASECESLEWGPFGIISSDDDAGEIFDERKNSWDHL